MAGRCVCGGGEVCSSQQSLSQGAQPLPSLVSQTFSLAERVWLVRLATAKCGQCVGQEVRETLALGGSWRRQ